MNVTISGTLSEAPQTTSSDGSAFPSGVTTIPFTQNPGTTAKQANASTGKRVTTVGTNGAVGANWVTLIGGGDADPQQIQTFYARATVSGGLQLRVTYYNGGTPLLSVVPVGGLTILEADVSNYITKVEASGAGQLEYYASGPQ